MNYVYYQVSAGHWCAFYSAEWVEHYMYKKIEAVDNLLSINISRDLYGVKRNDIGAFLGQKLV